MWSNCELGSVRLHYPQVNNAINAVVFDGRFEGRPIYLDIEDGLLSAIAEKLEIGIKGSTTNSVQGCP